MSFAVELQGRRWSAGYKFPAGVWRGELSTQTRKAAVWDCQCSWSHWIFSSSNVLQHRAAMSALLWLRKENVTYWVTGVLRHLGLHWKSLMHAERPKSIPIALWMRFTRQKQDWITFARLHFQSRPLQPAPGSSHPPATFSPKDLFCLTWATRFNLGIVEYVAAQQLTEGYDLQSLFHFSASSAPDVLFDTLVMFFACIYHSQVSHKCYGDHSGFANQVAGLRLDFSSRDNCKAGFNLSHRLQPWLLG